MICCGKVARQAAIYPLQLCKAILSGFRNQLREDGDYTVGMVGFQHRGQELSDLELAKFCRYVIQEDMELLLAKGAKEGSPKI